MSGEHRRGPLQGRADHLAHVHRLAVEHDPARLQARHVEEVGDEPREALGLVLDRARKFVARRGVVEIGVLPQGRDRPGDGRERGLEVVRERGEQGGAQPLRLHGETRLVPLGGEANPFDRDGGLVEEGVEKASLLGGQRNARPIAQGDPDHADHPMAGAQG